ncbi:MAG TPA: DUF4956 domain-containing protein [Clostridia bacterium]|nr:DUF4956 domain-containing protein [Clostridia bacterium]
MNGSLEAFLSGDGAMQVNWPSLLLGLILALTCGHVVSWVYMITHSGLSYSRTFVNALVLLPPIVCLVMTVLTNSLITAFGMMAVFAIVRFRNILRDTLDTTYVLISLVIGMATGTQKFASAIVGTVFICLTMLYLWYSVFGSRHRYDLIVNLHWGRSTAELPELDSVLKRHTWKALLASQRAMDGTLGADLSYRLLLRNSGRVGELMAELAHLPGVSRVTSMTAEDESEL